MAQHFFTRLRSYYTKVGEVLRGEADAATIFPNTSDIGTSREQVYATFLRQHAPSKCNVFLGGFLFDEEGNESKQLDVIITTDTSPKFDFHNQGDIGKSFSPVEGTLGVASIKSKLDKIQLIDALSGIASIPPTHSLKKRANPLIQIKNYADWPYKIIYASDGIESLTLLNHLNDFYNENSHIPLTRRPNVIHVAGKYVIFRILPDMTIKNISGDELQKSEVGKFVATKIDSDLHAIVWVLDSIQKNATASSHIIFTYSSLLNKVRV